MFCLGLAGFKIDVGKGVKFSHDYVAVVRTDAGGQGGNTLPVVLSRYGDELPVGVAELLVFKVITDHVYPVGISYQDDCVGEFFRS